MMLDIGVEAIERRVTRTRRHVARAASRAGAQVQCRVRTSPIIAARFDGHDASELARRLKERRVLVSARHGNLRVSAHFYNTEQDLDRLAEELEAAAVNMQGQRVSCHGPRVVAAGRTGLADYEPRGDDEFL